MVYVIQGNCPKHVEFCSKNKFEKLVHIVCCITRIYHDARSPKRHIYHDARSPKRQIQVLMLITKYTTYACLLRGAVLLEQLTGLQLVKKFPTFHGTRRFITALTSVRHLSLSWANPIPSIYPHPTSWRSISLLSTHLRLGLPSGLFPSGFPTKTLYTPLSSQIHPNIIHPSTLRSPQWSLSLRFPHQDPILEFFTVIIKISVQYFFFCNVHTSCFLWGTNWNSVCLSDVLQAAVDFCVLGDSLQDILYCTYIKLLPHAKSVTIFAVISPKFVLDQIPSWYSYTKLRGILLVHC